MKNILNRIFKIISSAIFVILIILIVLILAYVVRVKYLSSQGRLGDVKLNFYTILTQSMVPNIYAGDVVVTYKNSDNKYANGDILTFSSDINGGINITHRIIETYAVNGKYSYKTKGDNNSSPDNEIVKGERVLGKVVLKIPKIGFLQQFLTQKHRWIIVIVIPCLGIIIYDVLKLVKGFRKEEEYDIPEITKEEPVAVGDFDPPVDGIDIDTNPNENIDNSSNIETNEEETSNEEYIMEKKGQNYDDFKLEQEEQVEANKDLEKEIMADIPEEDVEKPLPEEKTDIREENSEEEIIIDKPEEPNIDITPVEVPAVLKPEEEPEKEETQQEEHSEGDEESEEVESLFGEEDKKDNLIKENNESKEDEDIELL